MPYVRRVHSRKTPAQNSGASAPLFSMRELELNLRPPPNLCTHCGNLSVEAFLQPNRCKIPESPNTKANDCWLCDLSGAYIEYQNVFFGSHKNKTNDMFTTVVITNNEGFRQTFLITSLASPEKNTPKDYAPVTEVYTEGWEKLNLARRWLEDSVEFAPRRERMKEILYPILPKRVLDVSRLVDQSEPDYIRLCCPEPNTTGQYLTLSYRWASTIALTTTTATIFAHCQTILFNELPKTFQDAVVVARALNVGYLWIDALCIVQDDDHDWKVESEAMSNIYANSLCTIAAHAASDTNDGFLAQSLSLPLTIRFEDKFTLRAPADVYDAVERSHLSQRAWVLQERYLSKRIVHFANGQIYWEDARGFRTEDIATEQHPRNEELSDSRDKVTINYWKRPSLVPLTSGDMEPPSMLPDWEHMIQRYSECQLTKESDKLIAISGLVKMYSLQIQKRSQNLDVSYAAGVWKYRAHRDLLWFGPPAVRLRKPTKRRAPTWSWASYDGSIFFAAQYPARFGHYPEQDFESIDFAPDQSLQGPKLWLHGSGSVVIRTALRPVLFVFQDLRTDLDDHVEIPSSACTVIYVRTFRTNSETPLSARNGDIYSNQSAASAIGSVNLDQDVERPFVVVAYCANISIGYTDPPTDRPQISFLILERHGDETDCWYERLGMGVIRREEWSYEEESPKITLTIR